MISYAQNFEDVILDRAFKNRSAGFYIDVGAMDPVDGSVTKAFYDRGWSGINIEPNTYFHRRLAAERSRDINLAVALGDVVEVRTLYVCEDQGLSTFSEKNRDYFAKLGYPWKPLDCPVSTLARVCAGHVSSQVDFLKIDAEGWEGPVLRGGDWRKYRPVILLIEATEPFSNAPAHEGWEPFLTGPCGYEFVYFDGLNRFYVRRESLELKPLFSCPANILDRFETYASVCLKEQVAALRVKIAAQDAMMLSLQEELDARRTAVLAPGDASRLAGNPAARDTEMDRLRDALARSERRTATLEKRELETRLWLGRLFEHSAAARRRDR